MFTIKTKVYKTRERHYIKPRDKRYVYQDDYVKRTEIVRVKTTFYFLFIPLFTKDKPRD